MSELIHRDFLNPLFLLNHLRPGYLTPDLEVGSVAEIDTKGLKRVGIRGIIFDVDNTLCGYHGTSVDERIRGTVELMKKEFKTCVISNTNDERRGELEEQFGLHVVRSKVKKPRPEPFLEALGYLGTLPQNTAVIGDRLLTDIVGANRLGMYSIKVAPLDPGSDPLIIRLARGFENFVLQFYRE